MTPDLNSPEHLDDAMELPKLQQQVEQALVGFNGMLEKIRVHQASVAKESAAITELREQLIHMRESVRKWERSLWKMGWRDDVSVDACSVAERQARTLGRRLDEVIWQTFDFRKRSGEGALP